MEHGAEIEFDANINFGVLYDYMISHTYSSAQGMLGTIVGALLIVAFTMNTSNVIYLIMGIVIIIYLPGSLFLKAKQQAMNPVFRKPIHYRMTDEGMFVSQGEEEQMLEWGSMYKAVSTRSSIILYTSRVNASIFPRRDLQESCPKLIEFISTHMPPNKVKIKS